MVYLANEVTMVSMTWGRGGRGECGRVVFGCGGCFFDGGWCIHNIIHIKHIHKTY